MAAEQKQCPQCGGKLVQEGAPTCPYCGYALGGEAAEGPHTARLTRMREHDQFSAAMGWTPTADEVRAAGRLRWQGLALVGLGLALGLFGALGSHFFWIGFGLVALFFGVRRLAAAQRTSRVYDRHPLARRPAIVTDRRSETAFNGWSGRVTYFFTMEFDDGLCGEFRFPGRGWPHEPLARGATGVAYTRGPNLVEFRHIKV